MHFIFSFLAAEATKQRPSFEQKVNSLYIAYGQLGCIILPFLFSLKSDNYCYYYKIGSGLSTHKCM